MSRSFFATCAFLLAGVAGCYTGGDVTTRSGSTTAKPAPAMSTDMTDPSGTTVTGVPCDVAQVLAKDCASCHSAVPVGGAPDPLMSYDDLMAPSVTDMSTSAAQMSLTRMKDTTNPMPPDGAPAEDLAILQKWIAAGMPKGTEACDATPAPSIYATDPVCSSGTKWTSGDRGSKSMRPGGACNKCHDQSADAPSYDAAGTIYKTAHEPDDCNGASANSMKVVVTDADGKVHTATVNSVGNFYFVDAIKMPYKAKVVNGSKSRAMSAPQKDGDCNKCHTENGTKNAPGRIMAP
jgi:hypothetical protein